MKSVLAAVSCLVLCSPVLAQTEKAQTEKVMEDKAPSAPVDIRSDHLTVHQKEHRAVFTGNVRTVQGDLEIRCEKLTVTYAGEKDPRAKAGEIKQMLFSGSVSIVQKKRRGHCNRAVYDRVAGRIVCTGKPWVVEGENRIRGERIVYLLEEDEVRVTRPQAVIRLKEDDKKKRWLEKVSTTSNQKLKARGLKKSFKGRCVVDQVDFEVGAGEVVGLLGPNGAGKTTSFHMVMGLLQADEGRVLLRDEDITAWPMYLRARAGVGYLSQEPSVFRSLSVRENLLLYLQAARVPQEDAEGRVDQVVAEFELSKVAGSYASTLSGGERRRLEIARAMVQKPSFFLLDEPFSGIDPLAVEEIRLQIGKLSKSGIGLLITDHNVRETLSSCDRAYILKDGKIIEEGTPAEIAGSERARRLYLGERFRLQESDG